MAKSKYAGDSKGGNDGVRPRIPYADCLHVEADGNVGKKDEQGAGEWS